MKIPEYKKRKVFVGKITALTKGWVDLETKAFGPITFLFKFPQSAAVLAILERGLKDQRDIAILGKSTADAGIFLYYKICSLMMHSVAKRRSQAFLTRDRLAREAEQGLNPIGCKKASNSAAFDYMDGGINILARGEKGGTDLDFQNKVISSVFSAEWFDREKEKAKERAKEKAAVTSKKRSDAWTIERRAKKSLSMKGQKYASKNDTRT